MILFTTLSLSVIGLALSISKPAYATETWLPKGKGKKSVGKSLKDAVKSFPAEVIASAKKWASKRGLPLIDVLTTILLESRGNPNAHALSSKEDSRGTMQVNIRAHEDLLKKLGYSADDLYKTDVGIEVGTHLLASKRKAVLDLVARSTRKQEYPTDVLTRLYYAGPKYTQAWILKGQHFKNMETYVDHWQAAKQAVNAAMTEGAYS